jgi:hypothetical protein
VVLLLRHRISALLHVASSQRTSAAVLLHLAPGADTACHSWFYLAAFRFNSKLFLVCHWPRLLGKAATLQLFNDQVACISACLHVCMPLAWSNHGSILMLSVCASTSQPGVPSSPKACHAEPPSTFVVGLQAWSKARSAPYEYECDSSCLCAYTWLLHAMMPS